MPQSEQSFVDGKKRPTLTLRLKLQVALYSTWRTNSPKAASRTERDSLVFASPFVFKSSTQIKSYCRVRWVVSLWRKSLLWFDTLRCTPATRRFAFSLRRLPGFFRERSFWALLSLRSAVLANRGAR